MDLIFDLGNQNAPRGHAILYYDTVSGMVATYLVVLPMRVDFAKYIPPVMASQVKNSGLEEFSAFAIPPIPEEIESYQFLEELAHRRGDDLIQGGRVVGDNPLEAAQQVNDVVQAYAELYQAVIGSIGGDVAHPPELSGMSVNEVMFSLMSEKEKLGEVAKLVGKLQFAVDGKDATLMQETEDEICAIARYLPENYNIPTLMEVVKRSMGNGFQLTKLYLERCYKLAEEDYLGIQEAEEAIRELESGAGQ